VEPGKDEGVVMSSNKMEQQHSNIKPYSDTKVTKQESVDTTSQQLKVIKLSSNN